MKTRDFFRYTARPLNIFILLCVLTFIIAFLNAISAGILSSFTQQNYPPKPQNLQWDIHNSRKFFMPDGKVFLLDSEYKSEKTVEIHDANYNMLWTGEKKDRPEKYKYLEWPTGFSDTHIEMRSLIDAQKITPVMSKSLEFSITQNKKIKEIWRYLPDDDIFVGYEFKGEKIGYIGANGFSQSQTESEPFGKFSSLSSFHGFVYALKDSKNSVLLWYTDKRFFAVDFENHKTEILIDGGDDKIYGIGTKNWSYDGKEPIDANYRTMVKYCTNDETIHLTLSPSDEKITIKTPKQWNDYRQNGFDVTATKDAIFLYHHTTDVLKPAGYDKSHKVRNKFYKTNPWGKATNYSLELYKVDKAGNLNLVNKFQWTKPEDISPKQKDWEYYLGYASVISPPIFYGGTKIIENMSKDINEFFPWNENGADNRISASEFEGLHKPKCRDDADYSLARLVEKK
jgi:hypothetical protein